MMMWLYLKSQSPTLYGPRGGPQEYWLPLKATAREEAEAEIMSYLDLDRNDYVVEARLIEGTSRDMLPVYDSMKRKWKAEYDAEVIKLKRAQLEQLKRELGEE